MGPARGQLHRRRDGSHRLPVPAGVGPVFVPILGGYAVPEILPANYYTRLVESHPLPLLVIEGGWPSETVAWIPSTPGTQRRYIEKHAQLLDAARAIGWC
jgi:hypothetical protein